MPQWLRGAVATAVLVALAAGGCGEAVGPPEADTGATPAELGAAFDAADTGTLRGRVVWEGPVPVVPRLEVPAFVPEGAKGKPRAWHDHPHAPRVDPGHRGVAGAVVFLKQVDVTRARGWHHDAVTVEQRDRRLVVVQGDCRSGVGFVRRGAEVELVSREAEFNSLHLGGAAFLTLAFPDPDQPLRRKLTDKGHVECSSAAGYFWMRCHLFVDEHPYYVRTDERGEFVLGQVPAGAYEVVCWLPNWHAAGHDLDPETGLMTRLRFRPPVTVVRSATVVAGEAAVVEFGVTAGLFEAAK